MRIKKTKFISDKEELNLLIDERIDLVDNTVRRLIFCVVEVPKSLVDLDKEKVFFARLKKETNVKKFHFTDINDPVMRQKIVKHIASMPIRVKTYIYYSIGETEDVMKKKYIKNVIKNTRTSLSKNKSLEFLIEDAPQYDEIIKEECLTKEDSLSIISDVFCYVSAMRLDYNKLSSVKQTLIKLDDYQPIFDEAFNMKWYNTLAEKIRLWTYYVNQKTLREKGDERPNIVFHDII